MNVIYSRKVTKANKVHKCGHCNDPIVKDEYYTTFTGSTGFSYTSALKACAFCEPILRYEGRIIDKDYAREIKYANSHHTWKSVAQLFGFDSYDDMAVYFNDATPAWHTKS